MIGKWVEMVSPQHSKKIVNVFTSELARVCPPTLSSWDLWDSLKRLLETTVDMVQLRPVSFETLPLLQLIILQLIHSYYFFSSYFSVGLCKV